MMRAPWWVAFCVLAGGIGIRLFAQAPGPYDDPRLLAWNPLAMAGDWTGLAAAIQPDLEADSPQAFAAYLWCIAQRRLGRLAQAAEALPPGRLRDRVHTVARIWLLSDDNERKQLLEEFPPSKAGEIGDYWALDLLAAAADLEGR